MFELRALFKGQSRPFVRPRMASYSFVPINKVEYTILSSSSFSASLIDSISFAYVQSQLLNDFALFNTSYCATEILRF